MALLNTQKLVFFLVKQAFRYFPVQLVLLLMVFQATEIEAGTTTYETEPNNLINNADPIISSMITGQLSALNDTDIYQFKIRKPTLAHLSLEVVKARGVKTHQVQIIDKNKKIYAGIEFGSSSTKRVKINFSMDEPNDYFINVKSTGLYDGGQYKLVLSLDPAPIYSSCEESTEEQTSCQGSKNYEKLLNELNNQNKIIKKSIADLTRTTKNLDELEILAKEIESLEFELATERNKNDTAKQFARIDALKRESLKSEIVILEKKLKDAEQEISKRSKQAEFSSDSLDTEKIKKIIEKLSKTLAALAVANSEIVQKNRTIENFETREKQILVELDESNLALAAALSQGENLKQELSDTTDSLASKLIIALAEKSELEKNNDELRKNLENALVARLAADALARSNLEEVKRLRLLLSQSEQEIENDVNLNDKPNTILAEQAFQIASIKSDPLTSFGPTFDPSGCDINVEFYNNDSEFVIKWSDGKPVKIYVEKVEGNAGQVYLSDENTLNGKAIEWGGRRFKLVIQNQNESSCEISEPDSFFEFRTEDEFIDVGSSPTAVISRDGSVVLKNVPLKQAKGKTLAVFLDTFVGPDRDAPQFGFNKAMIDAEFKILQKVYFKGFLNAVNSFILETAEFGNVEIYERSNESDTNYKSIFSKTKVNFNEFEKFKDDYISNDFIAGSKGTPLKKRTNHTQLVEENKNTVFVSFGSSGHNYEKACSSESRRDFKLNFHIFDIWPTETLDDLLDNELLIAVDEKRAYRCKDAGSIMGLKVSKAREEYEIENIIYSELKRISE